MADEAHDQQGQPAGDPSSVGDRRLDAGAAERLALVRYQLRQARRQLDATYPLTSLGINFIQDALESLMSVVVDHRQLSISKKTQAEFMGLFDAVEKSVDAHAPGTLSGFRRQLNSLNQARVDAKHHGNTHTRSVILRHLEVAEQFANILTTSVFGLAIDEVSLIAFVGSDVARSHLSRALERYEGGDIRGGMAYLRHSFEEVVRDFKERKRKSSTASMYRTSPSPRPSAMSARREGKEVQRLAEWVENMDDWVRILILGIDVRGYAYFRSHTPDIHYRLQGPPQANWKDVPEPTTQHFNRCFSFVLETALDMREDDLVFWTPWQETRVRDRFLGPNLPLEY